MKYQNALKTTLILTVLALMTACGQGKDASTDFSSRVTTTSTTTATSTNASCNQKTQDGLTAKLMVYADSTGTVRNDYMKLKITEISSDFASGSFLEFFRWQANPNSALYLDPTPVQARFETLSGQILTQFSPVIYWGQVSQMALNSGMITPNQFLQNVRLVIDIRDPGAQYDALKIAMYNSANAVTVNMDMLMPAFAANPADYAVDNGTVRSPTLQALHPFAGQTASTTSTAQFLSTLNGYCF
jgi:hypothetical protein